MQPKKNSAIGAHEWSQFEEQAPKIKDTTKVSHAVIRFNLRLARPSYVRASQSGKTEAIVKVATHARGFRVKNLLEYVARTEQGRQEDEQIQLEDNYGRRRKGQLDIDQIYNEWRQSFGRAKPGAKQLPRDATHLIFSAKAEKSQTNINKILYAARETARNHLDDNGFDYVIGLHQDADYPHVHFVVKTKNREPKGHKLRLGPAELFVIREDFAKKLSEQKLEHVATLRRDRPSELDKLRKQIATGIERIERKERQFQRAMARNAPDKNALLHRQAVHRNIVKLREKVKERTFKGSKERLDMLAAIRRLERALLKKGRDIHKDFEATIRGFGKAALVYRAELNAITGPSSIPSRKKLNSEQIENKKRFYDRQLSRLESELTQTREAIRAEPNLSADDKRYALDMLKLHEKTMKGRKEEYVFDKIVEQIAKDIQKLERGRKEGINPDTGKLACSYVEKLETRRALDKFEILLEKQVIAARNTFERSTASPAYKKEILSRLGEQAQKLARYLGKDRSR